MYKFSTVYKVFHFFNRFFHNLHFHSIFTDKSLSILHYQYKTIDILLSILHYRYIYINTTISIYQYLSIDIILSINHYQCIHTDTKYRYIYINIPPSIPIHSIFTDCNPLSPILAFYPPNRPRLAYTNNKKSCFLRFPNF